MRDLSLSSERKKPGPQPKPGPKAVSTPISLYPADIEAIRWWAETKQTSSGAAALRQMIDIAMSLTLGEDWAERVAELSREAA